MASVLIVFIISLVICCVIAYITGLFWFSDARNRRYASFFFLGIEVYIWALLNAIVMVINEAYFPVVYTLRMVFVCIVPFGAAWFVLDFSNSSLIRKGWFRAVMVAVPAIDVLFLITNPLHHLYFVDYAYPMPARAPVFWAHTAVDFLFIILAFVILITFIIKGVRRRPVLILAGVALMIPYTLNLLYSFGVTTFPHDTTPIGFFITLMIFVFVSYRLQLFNIKTPIFSSTMNSIDDVIVLFDEKLTIMEVNRSAEEAFADFTILTGRTKFDAFLAHLNSRLLNASPGYLLESLKSVNNAEGECAIEFPDGGLRTYTLSWHTVLQGRKRTGYVLKMSDVSSYREMIREINEQNTRLDNLRKDAESASRSKSEFLSRMSHEMRTPLNAIMGMAEVALKSNELGSTSENAVGKIKNASSHLLGVINDVLDMAKIESGKFIPENGEISLDELLETALMVSGMEQGRHKFSVNVDENVPRVLVTDGQRLRQVITNLLSNASKFTPPGGEISLSVEAAERTDNEVTLRFSVSDSGIGISEEQQARLFNPFEQADGSISRTYGGTGLGLSISKRIVEVLGGTIGVESKPGEGACFSFTVRAGRAFPGTGEKAGADEQLPAPNEFEGVTVLLAEDIEINREIINALLSESGVSFEAAENGREALDMFLAAPVRYDMIFMDIQMPEMDGIAATRAIRSSGAETAASIPIIAMTANAFKQDIDECFDAGMNGHLTKPVDVLKISDTIRRFRKK